jgi:hypothetical protein
VSRTESGEATRGEESLVDKEALLHPFSPGSMLTVYFGTPNMFTTLWFGFVYGTNPPLGILII